MEDCSLSLNNGPHKRYRKEDTPQPHKRFRPEDSSPSESCFEESSPSLNTSNIEISSSRIMYERNHIMRLRNSKKASTPITDIPFIKGVTINVTENKSDTELTKKCQPLFYAVARGPAKLGVFARSTIWDACNVAGFKRNGGKCVRCKETARGKSCYAIRGFLKREDATMYVYHHREDLADENYEEGFTDEYSEGDPMIMLRSDWCLELLDVERQKEVRPVLCQNWKNILHKFGIKERDIHDNISIETPLVHNSTHLDKSNRGASSESELDKSLNGTPSKLVEITRKIAIQYKNDGREQLQDKLRSLEEEQSKIKDNLLMEIIKSGVSLGNAKTEMEKKIVNTFKTVSADIDESDAIFKDSRNEFVKNLSTVATPRKIKRERSYKRDSSTKKKKNSKELNSSKRNSKTPKKAKLSYKTHKSNQNDRLDKKDVQKRQKETERRLSSIRNESLEKGPEVINRIMAGKWI